MLIWIIPRKGYITPIILQWNAFRLQNNLNGH